jgi:hypothetical protein
MNKTNKLILLAGITSCSMLGMATAANTAVVSSDAVTVSAVKAESVSLVLTGLK